jgi:hypothetical protein
LDPRVKVTPHVEQIFVLTKQVEDAARNAARAQSEVQAMIAKLQTSSSSAASQSLLKKLQELAPPPDPEASGNEGSEVTFGPRATAPPSPPTLTNISGRLVTSVMSMQGSELPPTESQLSASRKQLAAYAELMARWTALRARL